MLFRNRLELSGYAAPSNNYNKYSNMPFSNKKLFPAKYFLKSTTVDIKRASFLCDTSVSRPPMQSILQFFAC